MGVIDAQHFQFYQYFQPQFNINLILTYQYYIYYNFVTSYH